MNTVKACQQLRDVVATSVDVYYGVILQILKHDSGVEHELVQAFAKWSIVGSLGLLSMVLGAMVGILWVMSEFTELVVTSSLPPSSKKQV